MLGGCMPMPWQWACPECSNPIPSEDDDWECVAEPGKDIEQIKSEWMGYFANR